MTDPPLSPRPRGRHWFDESSSEAQWVPSVADFRTRKKRAAKAIRRGRPVNESDVDAGREWAKSQSIKLPGAFLTVLASTIAGAANLDSFAGNARAAAKIILVFLVIFAVCSLLVGVRAYRWLRHNRIE